MTTGAISPVRGNTLLLPIKSQAQQAGMVAFAGSGGNKSARNGASNSNGIITCGLVIAAALAAAAYFIFGGGGKKDEEGGDGDAGSGGS